MELTRDLEALMMLLGRTEARLESMAELAERKIALIRKADMKQMRSLVREEEALVAELQDQDSLRNKLMDRIGTRLGWPDRQGRSFSLRTMIERIMETADAADGGVAMALEKLALLADRLKSLHARATESNRRAGEVSRQVLSHFRHIFSAVARVDESMIGYSKAGATDSRPRKGGARILDTVG